MASRANVNDYLLGSKLYIGRTKSNEVRKSFCSGRLSLGIPLEFRYISVLPPMILRSFFDQSSIDLRFPNGGWTELERSSNGAWTELERSPNGAWTELERRMNGGWTELERSLNGGWTEDERRMNGERTEDERSSNGERYGKHTVGFVGWIVILFHC